MASYNKISLFDYSVRHKNVCPCVWSYVVCSARKASFVYEKCAQRGHSCSQENLHKCDLNLYMHMVTRASISDTRQKL